VFKEALTQIVRKLEDAKKGGLLRGYGLIGGLALAAGSLGLSGEFKAFIQRVAS
jgi:hypothetical protein